MNPVEIYQSMLDKVSRAALLGDVELYLGCMSLPYLIRTYGGIARLSTEDDLRAALLSLHGCLAAQGVTDYVRLARSAEYTSRDCIEGLHFTHILRNGERLEQPHAASQTLIRTAEGWRFAEARYAIQNLPFPVSFPRPATACEHPPKKIDWSTAPHA